MKSSDKENIINEALSLVLDANKKGISNYRIAKDTNITERTIGNYVNGNSKPTFANAKILIDYFMGIKENDIAQSEIPSSFTIPMNELWEIVKSQQQTIKEQQQVISSQQQMIVDAYSKKGTADTA